MDECRQRGYEYYWCHTHSHFGYCTPEHLNENTGDVSVNAIEVSPSVTSNLIFPALDDSSIVIRGHTVFGEPCSNECAKHEGYRYTWCTKVQPSSKGTWREADFCTNDHRVTPFGEDCVDECIQRGYDYYWCHKTSTRWGYCTPKHLLVNIENAT